MSSKKKKDIRQSQAAGAPLKSRIVLAMAFFSGFAGLIYQVLWMKQLGLLFGNTAYAASATLASFFAGLAAGSWFWGRRVSRSKNPLRMYALLEAGIAVTALVYFVILGIFYMVYPFTYQAVSSPALMLAVKFALALLLIFPPAFCMGGTTPVMGQYLIRNREVFGRMSALLYGINTFGAAFGVACAAFFLIPQLGFAFTCVLAIVISAGVGGLAWRLSSAPSRSEARISRGGETGQTEQSPPGAGPAAVTSPFESGRLAVWGVCFLSGFSVLALEVLWTRMFAQVHSNSVYAFAVILVVVLTCLALGAWISSQLARLTFRPLLILGALTVIGGAALVFGPSVFMHVTDRLKPLTSLEPWPQYMARLFYMGFIGVGFVVFALGMVFPFLMKAEERYADRPGRTLGRLLAVNTVGAIAGSLVCGFVFLPLLGMWETVRLIAALYLVAGLLIPYGWGRAGIACRSLGVIFLVLLFTVLDPSQLPASGSVTFRFPGEILETWEGTDCTVSVVENARGDRSIKINSSYVLGSTSAYTEQVNQAAVPLHIFPQTESVFFLGLGTGMTAGAALDPQFPNVKRIVACELVPEVKEAAEKYMPGELTGGVFSDPRATILIEDGRHYLMASDETFDMIIADLFLPYRRGAGSLYSLDHYRTAKKRLNPGGVFVQWLPLFQITEYEFGIITRTMLEAFGQVTMWRNNFVPGQEIVALIGHADAAPIPAPPAGASDDLGDRARFIARGQQSGVPLPLNSSTVPFFYCGNVTKADKLFEKYPVNTDDKPLIEYLAPRLFREVADQTVIWFVGPKIVAMIDRILELCPPASDPMLQQRSAANRHLVQAGTAFHCARIWDVLGDYEARSREWQTFVSEWSKSKTAEQEQEQ